MSRTRARGLTIAPWTFLRASCGTPSRPPSLHSGLWSISSKLGHPRPLKFVSTTQLRDLFQDLPRAILKTSWLEVLMNMKIVLDDQVTERSVRADLAWELFFKSKTEMPKGHGEPLLPFANWFWDEMGQRAGRLLKDSKGEATVTVPLLAPEALDFVVRLASFWDDEVYVRRSGFLLGDHWTRPAVNALDGDAFEG